MACVLDETLEVPISFRGILLTPEEWVEATTSAGVQLSVLEPPSATEASPAASPPTQLIKVREAARRLGVHENTIRNWVDQGKLHFVRLPGSGYRRLDPQDVDRLRASMYAGFRTGLAAALTDESSGRSSGVYQGGGQQAERGEGG